MTIKTTNAVETRQYGEEIAQKIRNGGVVCFYGDLGAGKTTLVQGIAKGLGIKKRVISPTFILMRRYEIPATRGQKLEIRTSNKSYPSSAGKKFSLRLNNIDGHSDTSPRCLWHIDLYRLQNIHEAKAIGIEELMADPTNILLIEWPEKIASLLPKNHHKIYLKSVGESEREIKVN